jgi:predicted  nucleic acid-binding Zn-ribbon protein
MKPPTTGYICDVALSDMVSYEQMIAQGIKVIDARGRKVPSVRAVKEDGDGVYVLALMQLRDESGAVVARGESGQEAVEFYGFIKGARIVPR